jgi:hypothetical protein
MFLYTLIGITFLNPTKRHMDGASVKLCHVLCVLHLVIGWTCVLA